MTPFLRRILRIVLPVAAFVLVASPSWAGCGCDHPPPAWANVMPPFGSPGRTLEIVADGYSLEVGLSYQVQFDGSSVSVNAAATDRLWVEVPSNLSPGPQAIRVSGHGVDHTYPEESFTALPRARSIKERTGVFAARNYDMAVGADGTAYLALDVSRVLDAMQFTFALHEIALHFTANDVVIYNADGVDLSLFTLDVDDATERQWGSYFGWDVEDDHGFSSTWYLPQSARFQNVEDVSSIFTYWRHEFHTYAAAHGTDGSHEVGSDGLHPNGTLHVDHQSLVIAIQAVERDASDPEDLSKAQPLDPGARRVDVAWFSLKTENPAEMLSLTPMVSGIEADSEELAEESD